MIDWLTLMSCHDFETRLELGFLDYALPYLPYLTFYYLHVFYWAFWIGIFAPKIKTLLSLHF